MNNYLLIYENGNGYRCHCCRSTWKFIETEEFESDEKAYDFAKEYNNRFDYNNNDCLILEIYKLQENRPIFEK